MSKNFYYSNPTGSDFALPGDDIVAAVENNFDRIEKELFYSGRVGNAGGMQTDAVWMEYNPCILGGKGGVELHILARGSDYMVDFDPTEKAKETVCWIGGAGPDDLPERYDFEITYKDHVLNPFADISGESDSYIRGVIFGLLNEVAANHCTSPIDNVYGDVITKMPCLHSAGSMIQLEDARSRVARARPKNDKETAKLLSRVSELCAQIKNPLVPGVSDIVVFQVAGYFRNLKKIKALAYYRKASGKTQQQAADELGCTLRQWQRYESSQASIADCKYSVVVRIADVVNTTPDKLTDGVTDIKVTP